MAENLLFTYTMLTDQRGGDALKTWLDVGGQFASYYDDSDSSILVRDLSDDAELTTTDFTGVLLDGVNSFSNPPIENVSEFLIYGTSDFSVCESTTYYKFVHGLFSEFPFVTALPTLNHYSCSGNVCDLIITTSTVTNASDDGVADGAITVTATSSLTVEYSLSDVEYGSGSSSGTFSGLTAGDYTIYCVDEYGCKVNTIATVGTTNVTSYGLLYRVSYADINGNIVRFDIKKLNYAGASSTITASGTPLRYVLNEVDQFDAFSAIRPSHVTVTIPELNKFDYRDLYTTDAREYLGVWTKDTGAGFDELWRGFLVPEVFSTSYSQIADLSLTFVDGLASLANEVYNEGQLLYSDAKLIDVVAKVLKTTDLDLPINVALNIYEDSQNSAATDDPLAQTYLDQETFYDGEEALNYAEILEGKILKPFVAKIVQWSGAWWIIRQEECKDDFDYRTFDKDGVYVSNGTYTPQQSIELSSVTTARAVWADDSATYEILPPARDINVLNKMGLRESILQNGNFERSQSVAFNVAGVPDYWSLIIDNTSITGGTIKKAGSNVYRFRNRQWTNNLNVSYIAHPQSNIQYRSGDKIRFSFKVGVDVISKAYPYMIIKARIKVGAYYLLEDGKWSTTATDCRFYPSLASELQEVSIETEFPATTVTVDTTLDVRVYNYQAKNPNFGEYSAVPYSTYSYRLQNGDTAFRGQNTTILPLESKCSVNGVLGSDTIFFYTLTASTDAESLPDIVRPDDYATTTNEVVWALDKIVKTDGISKTGLGLDLLVPITNSAFYVDDILVEVLPSGQDPVEEQLTKTNVNRKLLSSYEFEISASDVPTTFISSAPYIYNSFYKLSNGTNTDIWTRDGVNESTSLQQIVTKVLSRQYSQSTNKLSGTLTTLNRGNTHLDLTPLDCIVDSQDSDKIYYINGLEINDKELNYNVQLIDSKATLTDDGGSGASFNDDFNNDFGSTYATILT